MTKRTFNRAFTLGVLALVVVVLRAFAQPIPQGGMRLVVHDGTLSGSGLSTNPLIVTGAFGSTSVVVGNFSYTEVTPAVFVANTELATGSTATTERVDCANFYITGMTGGTAGRRVTLMNISAGNHCYLADYTNVNASATTTNRFDMIWPQAGDGLYYDLSPLSSVTVEYDGTTSRWKLIANLGWFVGLQTGSTFVNGNFTVGSGNTVSLGSLTILSNNAHLFVDAATSGFDCGVNTNATATCKINDVGYQVGTTQNRNLEVDDGKGAAVCTFTGSSKNLDCNAITVGGTTVSSGTGTLNVLPKWTPDGSHFGNSNETDDGTTLTTTDTSFKLNNASNDVYLDITNASTGGRRFLIDSAGNSAAIGVANRLSIIDQTGATTRASFGATTAVINNATTDTATVNGTLGVHTLVTGDPTSLSSSLGGTLYVVQPSSNWGLVVARPTANGSAPHVTLYKTRSTDASVKTAVLSGDFLGDINFQGATDSSTVTISATIEAQVNGTVATGSLPTDLVFLAGANGGGAENMRLSGTSGDLTTNFNAGQLHALRNLTVDGNSLLGSANTNNTIVWGYLRTRYDASHYLDIIPEGTTGDTNIITSGGDIYLGAYSGSQSTRVQPTGRLVIDTSATSGINTVAVNGSANAAAVTINNANQATERLRFTGQEFYQALNTSTDGPTLLLGVNRSGNRQIWMAESNSLTQNSTNPVLRFAVGSTIADVSIDALATDGITNKVLKIQNAGLTILGDTYVNTNQINARYSTNALAELALNYTGYNGGVTQNRNLTVYDGKNNTVCQFVGATKNLDCNSITVGGTGVVLSPTGTPGTIAEFTASNVVGNSTFPITDTATTLTLGNAITDATSISGPVTIQSGLSGTSSVTPLNMGDATTSVTSGDIGVSWGLDRNSGTVYSDTKVGLNQAFVERIGSGTNPGYTNSWQGVDGSGNITFYQHTTWNADAMVRANNSLDDTDSILYLQFYHPTNGVVIGDSSGTSSLVVYGTVASTKTFDTPNRGVGGYLIDGGATLYRSAGDGHLYLINPYNTNPTGAYSIIAQPSSVNGWTVLRGGNSTDGLSVRANGQTYHDHSTTNGVIMSDYFGNTSDSFGLSVSGYVSGDATSTIWQNAYFPEATSGSITNLAPKWRTTHGTFGSRGIGFDYSSNVSGLVADGGIAFYADSVATTADSTFTPTLRMLIANDGQVGINTSTPQYGQLEVNGTIASATNNGINAALYLRQASNAAWWVYNPGGTSVLDIYNESAFGVVGEFGYTTGYADFYGFLQGGRGLGIGSYVMQSADALHTGRAGKNLLHSTDDLWETSATCTNIAGGWASCPFGTTITYARVFAASPRGVNEWIGQITSNNTSNLGWYGERLFLAMTGIRDVRSRTFTFSIWAKAASGTPTLGMTVSRDPTSDSFAFGCVLSTTWKRCTVSGSFGSTAAGDNDNSQMLIYMYPNATTTTISLWGAQLEENNYATPYVRQPDTNIDTIGAYGWTNYTATGVPLPRATYAPILLAGESTMNPRAYLGVNGVYSDVDLARGRSLALIADTFEAGKLRKNGIKSSDTEATGGGGNDVFVAVQYGVNGSTIAQTTATQTSPRGVSETVGQITCTDGVNPCSAGTSDFRYNATSASHGEADVRGQTWTFSAWYKMSSGVVYQTINLTLGRFGDIDQGSGPADCIVNNQTWTRCSVTRRYGNTSAADNSDIIVYQQFLFTTPVYVYGAQLEQAPEATAYQKNDGTVAATYTTADQAVWGNELRAGGTMQDPSFIVNGSTVTVGNLTETVITAAAGNFNDWAPTGYGINTTVIELTSSSGTITGISAVAGTVTGRRLRLINDSGNTITLSHLSASSSAANRFSLFQFQNVTLTNSGVVDFMYISGIGWWQMSHMSRDIYNLTVDNTLIVSSTTTLTGNATLSALGQVDYVELVPSALAAGNNNNYAPSNFSTTRLIDVAGDAGGTSVITGLAGGTAGRVVTFLNRGAQKYCFNNEDANSTAANRFDMSGGLQHCLYGTAYIALNNDSATFEYNAGLARWVMIAKSSVVAPRFEVTGTSQVDGTFSTISTTNLATSGSGTTIGGSLEMIANSTDDIIWAFGAFTSGGNNNLDIDAGGTGAIRFNYNAGGLTHSGTGGLALYAGNNGSTTVWTVDNAGNSIQSGTLQASKIVSETQRNDFTRGTEFFDDFLAFPTLAAAGGNTQWVWSSGIQNFSSSINSTDSNRPGIIGVTTSANGVGPGNATAYIYQGDANVGGVTTWAGGGQIDVAWGFNLSSVPNATTTWQGIIGMAEAVGTITPTDGIYCKVSGASANVQACSMKASTATCQDTSSAIAMTANHWYRCQFQVNAGGTSISYTVSDITAATSGTTTITTNIPNTWTNAIGMMASAVRSATTGSGGFYVDYAWFKQTFTTAR